MANEIESLASHQPAEAGDVARNAAPGGWLRVGAIAAASAVLGGLAAAWFYRKTLTQLREAEESIPDSGSMSAKDDSPEDF